MFWLGFLIGGIAGVALASVLIIGSLSDSVVDPEEYNQEEKGGRKHD